ncbi:MAG: IS1595 family transposase [Caulobacterales bacterium]
MTARKTNLRDPIYHDENAARAYLESLLWPHGPVCPHCGVIDKATAMKGATTRPGLYKCKTKECRKPFTVTMKTVMERSHIPLTLWLLAAHYMAASKKGMSALQLQRMTGTTYETAWFLFHRLREAAREVFPSPLGGEGKTIEADETYVGGREKNKHANKRLNVGSGSDGKQPVVTLVERDGRARSFHVANVTAKTVRKVLTTNAHRSSRLMTDGATIYLGVGSEFASHGSTDHAKGEYVRDGGDTHSNAAEAYFAILKRGVYGTFHHVSEAHLHRYLSEFDFRWSNREALGITDDMRAAELLRGAKGKRLMYRQPREAAHA